VAQNCPYYRFGKCANPNGDHGHDCSWQRPDFDECNVYVLITDPARGMARVGGAFVGGGSQAYPPGGQARPGLKPNIAGMLCYLPLCCVGFLASMMAAVVRKDTPFVRFHAFQSLLLHAVAGILLLGAASLDVKGGEILVLAFFGLLIFLMIKAHSGQEFELPVVGPMARKLSAPRASASTVGSIDRASVSIARPVSPNGTRATGPAEKGSQAGLLLEANQLLRYRAPSKAKADAQIAFTDALLSREGAPRLRLVLLRAVDPQAEYPWLVLKAGTTQAIHSYAGSEEVSDRTFAALFGDQPRSIIWADHIAENCPRPGEAVTQRGRQVYGELTQAIREGRYAVERVVRE
jgi:uncharacterized membrane protein